MPITDAVYGPRSKRGVEKADEPRGHTRKLWEVIPRAVADEMAYLWGGVKKKK